MKILIFLFLSVSNILYSRLFTNTSIFPVAAYSPGAYDTFWQTDLCIFNPNSFQIEIDANFYCEKGKFNKVILVEAENVKCIQNVIHSLYNYEGMGLLTLETSQYFFDSWIRIYNTKEDGGTYGQGIQNQFFEVQTSISYLFGITKNSRFRTNIGLASFPYGATFDFELYDKDGLLIKKYNNIQVREKSVLQFPMDVEIENAFLRIIPKDKNIAYYAYMSLIDNITGDAVYTPAIGEFPEN
ncbi:MAG: hypothetical protein WHV67_05055 [Thermoanaerobaculia bacterium]